MASTHELFVVQAEDGVVAVEEVGVEDDFDAVVFRVEELDAPDLVEDRVVGIIRHVVGRDGWERVSLESEDSSFEEDSVLIGEEAFRCWQCSVFTIEKKKLYVSFSAGKYCRSRLPIRTHGMFEQTSTETVLNLSNRVTKLLYHSLSFERIDSV